MKRIVQVGLSLVILWLTACAPNTTSIVAPARSGDLSPTATVAASLARPAVIVTASNAAATANPTTPSPTLTRAAPVTTASPACPPLPTPTPIETQAALQHFEHGLMFWLQSQKEIWVLIASPTPDQFYWRVLPDSWSDSQPESDPAIHPPAGKFQPIRGFGLAWRSGGGSNGPQRADLGWALDEETGFTSTLIYYPQGFYSPDCVWMPKSGIYELRDDQGRVVRFVGAGGVAKFVTDEK